MEKNATKWRVYHAPDGCDISYCGEYETLEAAQEAAEAEPDGLPKYLWDTARAAGHCNGMYAPPRGGVEEEEAQGWYGRAGWHFVVRTTYQDR